MKRRFLIRLAELADRVRRYCDVQLEPQQEIPAGPQIVCITEDEYRPPTARRRVRRNLHSNWDQYAAEWERNHAAGTLTLVEKAGVDALRAAKDKHAS